jgi:hypothetical protein
VKQSRPPRPRRHRLHRAGKWAALCVGFVFLALGLFIYYVPVSSTLLNRRVAQRFEEATGLRLTFADARLFAARRTYEMLRCELWSPDLADEPLLSIRELDVHVKPLALLFGSRSFIRSITVREPSRLEMVYGADGIAPGGKSGILLAALRGQHREPERRTGMEIPFDSLRVYDASLVFVQREAATSPLPHRRAGQDNAVTSATVHILDLYARTSEAGAVAARVSGFASTGRGDSPFDGTVTVSGRDEGSVDLEFERIRLPQLLPGMPSGEARARAVKLTLRMSRKEGVVACSGNVSADALSIGIPRRNIEFEDQALRIEIAADFSPTSRSITVRNASVNSNLLSAEIEGALHLDAPSRYDLHVSARKLGKPYRDLLNRALPRGYNASADDDSFVLNVAASGEKDRLTALVGKLTFTSVSLRLKDVEKAVEEVSGEMNFEPGRLVLHGIAARFGRTSLSVEGELQGDYLVDRAGELNLRWHSSATADDLLAVLKAATPDEMPWRPRKTTPSWGKIETEGVFKQYVSLVDPAATRDPEIDGTAKITHVSFDHPALPAPITDLNGTLAIRNNRVEIASLRGELQGNAVDVKGVLGGNRYFWADPVLTASASLRANLAEIVSYLPPKLKEACAKYDIRGDAECRTRLVVWLRNPEEAVFTGEGELHKGSFNPALDFMNGSVTDIEAGFSWNGETLRFSRLGGKLNGEAISGSVLLSPETISVSVKSAFDLENLQRSFPKLQKWYDMAGPATCDATFSILNEPVETEPGFGGKLVPLLTGASERLNTAVGTNTFRMSGSVTVGSPATGATIRHNAMPMARTLPAGIVVPRGEMANMRGTAILEGHVLRVSETRPATCNMSDTADCRLSGAITYVPNEFPSVEFLIETDGEARLDTWITGWGQQLQVAPAPPAGEKSFRLDGRIVAASATYKRQNAGRVSTNIHFEYDQDKPPRRTEFKNLSIQGFGGALAGSGYIETWRWDDNAYPRWGAKADVRGMRIAPLMICLFRDPNPIEGVISTNVSLTGLKTDSARINAQGTATLRDVEVGRIPPILRLFQVLNLTQTRRGFFEKAVYNSKPDTPFQIANGALTCNNLALETEGLLLEMRGSYFFEPRTVDALVRLNIFESSLLGAIPIIDELAKLADRTLGRFIVAFRVSGPAARPSVQPVPLPLFQGAEILRGPGGR